MPQVNVASFNKTVETLENMVQGVNKLKTTPGFPPVITEKTLTEMITDLKAKRNAYELASANAAELYNKYTHAAKDHNAELSRFKLMLYGFFGPRNPIVHNFGIRPYKGKSKAGKTSATQPVNAA